MRIGTHSYALSFFLSRFLSFSAPLPHAHTLTHARAHAHTHAHTRTRAHTRTHAGGEQPDQAGHEEGQAEGLPARYLLELWYWLDSFVSPSGIVCGRL